jgi:hypothetical protein
VVLNLYKRTGTDFRDQVHPTLRRRIRIFLILGTVMLVLTFYDVVNGTLSWQIAGIGILVGAVIGLFSSRIFKLSWDHDGEQVVGKIDAIGWVILALYILFEIGRSTLFATVFQTSSSATAITFAFVSAALISRVLGLRGRIIDVLTQEHIFK